MVLPVETNARSRFVDKLRWAVALAFGLALPVGLGAFAESRAPVHATVSRFVLFIASTPVGLAIAVACSLAIAALVPRGNQRTIGTLFAFLYAWYAGYSVVDTWNCRGDDSVHEARVAWVAYERPRRGSARIELEDPTDEGDTIIFDDAWVGGALGTRVARGTQVSVSHGAGRLGFAWVARVSGYEPGIR